MKGKSTEIVLHEVVELIASSIRSGEFAIAAFLLKELSTRE